MFKLNTLILSMIYIVWEYRVLQHGVGHPYLSSSTDNQLEVGFMSYAKLVSQLVPIPPYNRTPSLHELCLLVLNIPSIEEKLTVWEEVNRSHSHIISELASGKDWAIADSPRVPRRGTLENSPHWSMMVSKSRSG